MERSIHHTKCNDCNKDYIGETEGSLLKCFREHHTRSKSVLREYRVGSGHGINLNNLTVLETEPNLLKGKIRRPSKSKPGHPASVMTQR